MDSAEGTWGQRNATLKTNDSQCPTPRLAAGVTVSSTGRTGRRRESVLQYKRTLGNSLRACGYESQKREAMIGCNVLNRMAKLGKTECHAIVGE